VNIHEAKKIAGVEFKGKDQAGIARALESIKAKIVKARRVDNDDERAKILSEAKQVFKKMMPSKCAECGATISAKATHCRLHQSGERKTLALPKGFEPRPKRRAERKSRARADSFPKEIGIVPVCTIIIDGEEVRISEKNATVDRLPLHKALEATTNECIDDFRRLCRAYAARTLGGLGPGFIYAHMALMFIMDIAENPEILTDPEPDPGRKQAREAFLFSFATCPEFAALVFQRVRAALPKKSAERQKALVFLRTAPEAFDKSILLQDQAKLAGVTLATLKAARRDLVKLQPDLDQFKSRDVKDIKYPF
jgi:hypothetical protein